MSKIRKFICELRHATPTDIALWAAVILLAIILSGAIFQLVWPFNPVRVDRVCVMEKEIARGDVLHFQFHGEKYLDIPVHATVELVNGENVGAMSYVSHNPPGNVFKPRSFVVPYHMMPGKYKLKWTGVYEISPIRTVTKTYYTEEIMVK